MKFNLKGIFFVIVAVASGLVVLLGYFLSMIPAIAFLRESFLRWATVLAAVMLVVGVINLARVHWRKFTARQEGAGYSIILLISLFLTIGIMVVDLLGLFATPSTFSLWLLNYIQVPIESSLMAVLAIILAYAMARLLNRRLNLFSLIFIGTALFVILGTASLPGGEIPGLRWVRDWIVQVWAVAGARGILLGVGLGTVATGLRILMGSDRPYGG